MKYFLFLAIPLFATTYKPGPPQCMSRIDTTWVVMPDKTPLRLLGCYSRESIDTVAADSAMAAK